jgi:hypothetical protein
MLQIIKWTNDKPNKPGYYWYRSAMKVALHADMGVVELTAPLHSPEGCLIEVVTKNDGKLVGKYATPVNTSHITYIYLENLSGMWAEYHLEPLDVPLLDAALRFILHKHAGAKLTDDTQKCINELLKIIN